MRGSPAKESGLSGKGARGAMAFLLRMESPCCGGWKMWLVVSVSVSELVGWRKSQVKSRRDSPAELCAHNNATWRGPATGAHQQHARWASAGADEVKTAAQSPQNGIAGCTQGKLFCRPRAVLSQRLSPTRAPCHCRHAPRHAGTIDWWCRYLRHCRATTTTIFCVSLLRSSSAGTTHNPPSKDHDAHRY